MNIDNVLLITLVQRYDCLYNPQCKGYKSRQTRDEAWASICKEAAGEAWEELSPREKEKFEGKVQKRWKCLKDAYSRSLRTRVEKSDGRGKTWRPYVYEQQMWFLKRSVQSTESMEVEDSSVTEQIVVNIDPEEAGHSKPSAEPAVKRRRTPASDTPPVSFQYNEEADKMFLLSLLPSMQDMGAVEKIDFKIKVMNLLKDNIESRERRRLCKSKTVSLITTTGQVVKERQSSRKRVEDELDELSSVSVVEHCEYNT